MSSVDVVVPCYNYARFLPRCVKSLLDQEGVDVRVLVIDDASSDNTPEVAQSLVAADSRVEFIRHTKNAGHIATYNEGLLGWAKADYSLLISADDLLAPGAMKRAADLMDRHPDVGLTYGMASIIVDDSDPPVDPGRQPGDYQVLPSVPFLKYCCEKGNPVPTPTAIVRTRLQQEFGGYLPQYPHTADFEMWMRFGIHGPVGIIRAVQAYYRLHQSNMSTQYYTRPISDRRERLHACQGMLSAGEKRVPELRAFYNAMAHRLSDEAFWIASHAFDDGDAAACRTCLDFAEEANPALRNTSTWWKLRMKLAIGPAAWHRLQPLVDGLRGVRREQAAKPTFNPAGHGEQIGWWPLMSGTPST